MEFWLYRYFSIKISWNFALHCHWDIILNFILTRINSSAKNYFFYYHYFFVFKCQGCPFFFSKSAFSTCKKCFIIRAFLKLLIRRNFFWKSNTDLNKISVSNAALMQFGVFIFSGLTGRFNLNILKVWDWY